MRCHYYRGENQISDVLYEVLAQHYGLETNWLDITSDFIIQQIKNLTDFSEKAFDYALERRQYFAMKQKDDCREKLENFEVSGRKIRILESKAWNLGSSRRKAIDRRYNNFFGSEYIWDTDNEPKGINVCRNIGFSSDV